MRGQSTEHMPDTIHAHDMTSDKPSAHGEIDFAGWLRRVFGVAHDRHTLIMMNPDGKIVCVDRADRG